MAILPFQPILRMKIHTLLSELIKVENAKKYKTSVTFLAVRAKFGKYEYSGASCRFETNSYVNTYNRY